MKNLSAFALVLSVSSLITLAGVFLFFQPIAESDDTVLILPPAAGLIYLFLCACIYLWAFNQIRSSYKAAMVLALPQIALIIDLLLRGDRGLLTTVAGSGLLLATWLITAAVHSRFHRHDD